MKYCEKTKYCRINRTPLIQTGYGVQKRCPICDSEKPEETKENKSKLSDWAEDKFGYVFHQDG